MDNYELLKITEGKNRKKSLVYHILDRKKGENYELLIHTRGRGTGTAVLGRRRTPDGEGRRTEDFLRLRPPKGRKRTADRLTFVRSGRRRTPDGGVRPPQGRIRTADR